MTKLNKGARKVIDTFRKKGYDYPKRKVADGSNLKVVVDKVFRAADMDKEFHGTAKRIVLDMRFWDTALGRCNTNAEYMKIVAGRVAGMPNYTDEVKFLKHLDAVGMLTLELAN
jgi:hypothetical protein|tara:strand:+ start:3046 stop:3387 length:342 start_codon:yes stop_codon:yes gene_type:complete